VTQRVRFGVVALATAVAAAAGLHGRDPARRLDSAAAEPHRAGILQIAWRTTLHDHGLFEPAPEECATGVLAQGRLVIGSRAGARSSASRPETATSTGDLRVGGVDSEARFDASRGQAYVGADDGSFYAVDVKTGAIRLVISRQGRRSNAPPRSDPTWSTSATAADRIVALEPATESGAGNRTRHARGVHDPRLRGSAPCAASSCCPGLPTVTSSRCQRPAARWCGRSPSAAASDQFVDVDSTPALTKDAAYVSSYSGGLYSLDPRDGSVRWRLGIEGVGDVTADADRLYFVAPRYGLHAAHPDGHVLWRQGLSEAGDLTPPVVVGNYLIFSGSRAGMFVVDSQQRRAAGDLQPRPGRLRRADGRRREPPPVRVSNSARSTR
jgi:outer membrane protein assembly factor BamB